LTLHFEVESVDLARMLVFGLGQDARIIEPATLQESVLQTAREIVERLSSDSE
jgi:predicted DNA-binding transcriptional regulator YafY